MLERRVILVRGLPGSGKSTWVRDQIKDLPEGSYAWCSNDHYFEETGLAWTEEEWRKARAITREKVERAYADPKVERIFIDNVHLSLKTISGLLNGIATADIQVVEFVPKTVEFHHRRTVHNVPYGTIKQMIKEWDRISFKRRFGYAHTWMYAQGD